MTVGKNRAVEELGGKERVGRLHAEIEQIGEVQGGDVVCDAVVESSWRIFHPEKVDEVNSTVLHLAADKAVQLGSLAVDGAVVGRDERRGRPVVAEHRACDGDLRQSTAVVGRRVQADALKEVECHVVDELPNERMVERLL